jgi:hypothetical protein
MLACALRFDGPVILFQDIIEILHGTVFGLYLNTVSFGSAMPADKQRAVVTPISP